MNHTTDHTLKPNTSLQGKSYTYTIQKVLGQGTFGITYLATTQVKVAGALGEIETTIQVAVKEFFMKEINGRQDNTVTSGSQGGLYDKYKQKFAREAKNLSKLHHPRIVKILEYFEANNTVYYAMEYIDGGNLDEYIDQKKGLPEEECVKYTRQIGAALSYMHAHKMLHLDLKPKNVMLRKDGEAVLIDFGLSKQYDEHGEPESSTTVGGGTPGYAPLEQANYHDGKGFPVTMDAYALGATMFKMLTGVKASEAADIYNDGFPAYELQNHHVSDTMIACVAKAMSPSIKNRPQSVDALLQELTDMNDQKFHDEISVLTKKAFIENKLENQKPNPIKPSPIFKRKHKKLLGGVSVCILIICAFIIIKSMNRKDIEPDVTLPLDSLAIETIIDEAHDSLENIIEVAPFNTAAIDSTATVEEVETQEERFQKAMKLQGKAREKTLLQLANEGYAYTYFPLAQYYFSTRQNGQADKWLAKSLSTVDRFNAEDLIEQKINAGDFSLVKTMREIERKATIGHKQYYCLLAKWYLGRNEDAQADKWLRKAIGANVDKRETRPIEQTLRDRGFYD